MQDYRQQAFSWIFCEITNMVIVRTLDELLLHWNSSEHPDPTLILVVALHTLIAALTIIFGSPFFLIVHSTTFLGTVSKTFFQSTSQLKTGKIAYPFFVTFLIIFAIRNSSYARRKSKLHAIKIHIYRVLLSSNLSTIAYCRIAVLSTAWIATFVFIKYSRLRVLDIELPNG